MSGGARFKSLSRFQLTVMSTLAVQSLGLSIPRPLRGQTEAIVEALAPVLASEDARRFDGGLLSRSALSPDPVVRRVAAMSIGRLGDPRGLTLLEPLLADPDTSVQGAAVFAVGLMRDPSGVPLLISRLRDPAGSEAAITIELITAIARIGGPEAGTFFRGVLSGSELAGRSDHDLLRRRAAGDAWRLGKDAPIGSLIALTSPGDEDLRTAVFYSLARLRPPEAAPQLLEGLTDRNAQVRTSSSRALTKAYADTTRLDSKTIEGLLARNLVDPDLGVRTQSLRTISSYDPASAAGRIVSLLNDPVPSLSVEAATVLGRVRAPEVAAALRKTVSGKGNAALRRAALTSLAKTDSTAFLAVEPAWTGSNDWRDRAAAAEAWMAARPGGRPEFLADQDGRVVAAALQAWSDAAQAADSAFVATCRKLLSHSDAAVRSLAADGVARAPTVEDIPALSAAYRRAGRDSFPEARLSALAALNAIARGSETAAKLVDQDFLTAVSSPDDYVVRRWAAENWPSAAARWDPAFPVQTGRTLDEYRTVARTYIVGKANERAPHVIIQLEQRGEIELELFGPDAPLTVDNFLRLVDRRYFDGLRWHRVVPNFVVQTGDPRGDGWGGPGGAIRDELNRRRYYANVVGMALSGPDTGGSQWFITLSAQPHLDAAYTVFGQVVGGFEVIPRLTQGDVIRSIKR